MSNEVKRLSWLRKVALAVLMVSGFAVSFAIPAVAADTIFKDGNLTANVYASSSVQNGLKGGRMGPEGQQFVQFTTRTLSGGRDYASVTASSGAAADMNHGSVTGNSQCKFSFLNGVGGETWVICKYRK